MVYRRPFPGLGVRCPGINRVLYDFIPKPTGTVESSEITHSGTGRFTWLKMRTMSLYESEELSGEVSLENLFSGPEQIRSILISLLLLSAEEDGRIRCKKIPKE